MNIKFDVLYSMYLPVFSVQFCQADNLKQEIFQLFSIQHTQKLTLITNYVYNENYKDPKEKNIRDFNVRNRVGENANIFILSKFLFRKDIHNSFFVLFCFFVMPLQDLQVKELRCLEILDTQGYKKP